MGHFGCSGLKRQLRNSCLEDFPDMPSKRKLFEAAIPPLMIVSNLVGITTASNVSRKESNYIP